MDTSIIISLITSSGMIGSMILNWFQWRSSKKGAELNNFEKQLEILEKLQKLKDEKYQAALKVKDQEIEALKKELQDVNLRLDQNTEKIAMLQSVVNRLIGGGCKNDACQDRIPYPIDELKDILNIG